MPFARLNLCALAAIVITVSCGGKDEKPVSTYRMGERVQMGNVVFNVIEADWRAQMNSAKQVPKNRYVVIHLTANNGGTKARNLPLFRLKGAGVEEFREYTDIENMTGWLGTLRTIPPNGALDGYIVFDAPLAPYKLELNGGGDDPETEMTAYVEIPAQFTPLAPSVSGPEMAAPVK